MKITAYDYSIYGGLEGEVTMISPDTLQDEVKGMSITIAFISVPTVIILRINKVKISRYFRA